MLKGTRIEKEHVIFINQHVRFALRNNVIYQLNPA